MALELDINFNKLLDRVTIGDYLLHIESGELYRVIKHKNVIYTLDVENADIISAFSSFSDFLKSELMKSKDILVIKESRFKLTMKEE